jgi:hypothetical protein
VKREAEERFERKLGRQREAANPVALPITGDGRVDRQRQTMKAGVLAARDELGGQAAILEDVNLKDLRPCKCLREFLEPRRSHR